VKRERTELAQPSTLGGAHIARTTPHVIVELWFGYFSRLLQWERGGGESFTYDYDYCLPSRLLEVREGEAAVFAYKVLALK
jgi:hypothetical protein